ncbi:uncharacterized protein DS421_15g492370 [Arachis hypogaea]|nr:uncharacterized protein DS421_15g492370 [Arachis hypogaea]
MLLTHQMSQGTKQRERCVIALNRALPWKCPMNPFSTKSQFGSTLLQIKSKQSPWTSLKGTRHREARLGISFCNLFLISFSFSFCRKPIKGISFIFKRRLALLESSRSRIESSLLIFLFEF